MNKQVAGSAIYWNQKQKRQIYRKPRTSMTAENMVFWSMRTTFSKTCHMLVHKTQRENGTTYQNFHGMEIEQCLEGNEWSRVKGLSILFSLWIFILLPDNWNYSYCYTRSCGDLGDWSTWNEAWPIRSQQVAVLVYDGILEAFPNVAYKTPTFVHFDPTAKISQSVSLFHIIDKSLLSNF